MPRMRLMFQERRAGVRRSLFTDMDFTMPQIHRPEFNREGGREKAEQEKLKAEGREQKAGGGQKGELVAGAGRRGRKNAED